MAVASQSDVEITLGDETAVLRCVLRAAKTINARFGSYTIAYERIAAFDQSAFVAIVAAGLGKSEKEVESQVFESGMHGLVIPLTEYLTMLLNGGKPLPKADAENGENDPPGEG